MSADTTPTDDAGLTLPTTTDNDVEAVAPSVEVGQQRALHALADRTAMLADVLTERIKVIGRYQKSIADLMPGVKHDPSELVVDIDHAHLARIEYGMTFHAHGYRAVSFRGHYLWITNSSNGTSIVRPSDATVDDEGFLYSTVTNRQGLELAPLSNLPYNAQQKCEWTDLVSGDLVAPEHDEISFTEASPATYERVSRLIDQLGHLSGLKDSRTSGAINLVAGQLVDEFGFVRVTPAIWVGGTGQHLRLSSVSIRVTDPAQIDNQSVMNLRWHNAEPGFTIQQLADVDLAIDTTAPIVGERRIGKAQFPKPTTHVELFTTIHEAAAARLAEMIRETHQHVTALD